MSAYRAVITNSRRLSDFVIIDSSVIRLQFSIIQLGPKTGFELDRFGKKKAVTGFNRKPLPVCGESALYNGHSRFITIAVREYNVRVPCGRTINFY